MEVFGEAKSDWFETFLELPHGVPSHDTFNRVFAALDPEKFLECFIRWTQSLRAAIAEEIVALDGKALRRASNAGECPKIVVSAWAAKNGLALRLHCDIGCDGLPKGDCQRNQGGRCRLGFGA